ncbi:Rgp1-domain-containing protein [Backusella circina FSU 941]|nr:Rgp1-domain-containing protein [Backusella circina FSU 941]
MSISVTTSFSQGAVFYAGETVDCTIAFTHSPSKRQSRSYSLNIPPDGYHSPPAIEHFQPQRKLSLSSLASSTYSFFTSPPLTKEPESLDTTTTNTKEWKEEPLSSPTPSLVDMQMNDTIELDNVETPRSSVDYNSQRSSIDSYASSIQQQHYHNQSSLHRLSILQRSSSNASLYSRPCEQLLWGFAQVIGQFVADPALIDSKQFKPLKSKTMYHPFGSGIGGGGAMLLSKQESHKKKDSNTTPVFSTPPSVLFVDLNLAPGETVKYSYKLTLPQDIPPSYRGKSMRFNYHLVVGTQRSSGSQGHVVHVPFRVLNYISDKGTRPVYDLMSPVVHYRDQAIIETVQPNRTLKKKKKLKDTKIDEQEKLDFMNYIDGLLDKTTANKSVHKIMQRENDLFKDEQQEQESCKQIIARMANISKRATFDICKGNQRVAQLHLVKSLHRLGEPILGLVDFEGATLPTFQLSILLESNEIVDSSLSIKQPQHIARVSRKRHAEHHSYCRHDKSMTFSLTVPSSESPEFQTSKSKYKYICLKLQYYLKLEFITGQQDYNDFDPISDNNKSHHHYEKQSRVPVTHFDCQIPLRIFGSSHLSFHGEHKFTVQ